MRSRFWDFSQKGVHILGFWVYATSVSLVTGTRPMLAVRIELIVASAAASMCVAYAASFIAAYAASDLALRQRSSAQIVVSDALVASNAQARYRLY